MPLTAAEVRATRFSTTRMRSGYDIDEVDAFLDIVEADLTQLADDLQRSRDGEAVLRTQSEQLSARLATAEGRLAEAEDLLARARAHPVPVVAAPDEPVEPPTEVLSVVSDDPEASAVLALAQRTADEMVRAAQGRADHARAAVRAVLEEQLRLLG